VINGMKNITKDVIKERKQLAKAALTKRFDDDLVNSSKTIGLIIEKHDIGKKTPAKKIYILFVAKPKNTHHKQRKFIILNR
jgi:hypothetical protein